MFYCQDIINILKKWPGFINLTTQQAQDLIGVITNILIPHAQQNGFIDDQVMYDIIQPILPDELENDQYQRAKTIILPNAFNRWRCTWINHKGTIQKRQDNMLQKVTKKRALSSGVNDKFSQLKVTELSEACSVRNLLKSGEKPELLLRLREFESLKETCVGNVLNIGAAQVLDKIPNIILGSVTAN